MLGTSYVWIYVCQYGNVKIYKCVKIHIYDNMWPCFKCARICTDMNRTCTSGFAWTCDHAQNCMHVKAYKQYNMKPLWTFVRVNKCIRVKMLPCSEFAYVLTHAYQHTWPCLEFAPLPIHASVPKYNPHRNMPTYNGTWKLHACELVHEYWWDRIWKFHVWTYTWTPTMPSGRKLHGCKQLCTHLHMAVLRSCMPVNMPGNCMCFSLHIHAYMLQCLKINTLRLEIKFVLSLSYPGLGLFSTAWALWLQARRFSPSAHSGNFRLFLCIWNQSVLLFSSSFPSDFVQRCKRKPTIIVICLLMFKGFIKSHWIPYTKGESGSSGFSISINSLNRAHHGFSVHSRLSKVSLATVVPMQPNNQFWIPLNSLERLELTTWSLQNYFRHWKLF